MKLCVFCYEFYDIYSFYEFFILSVEAYASERLEAYASRYYGKTPRNPFPPFKTLGMTAPFKFL